MNAVVAVLGAYLLGSISFSYLIVKALSGVDIRTVGSGNAGATNVLRVSGKAPAAAALLLDAGKGLAAVLLARFLEATDPVVALVGFAAVLGHIYPLFFGLRGGKGVATAAGTLGSLAPLATLMAFGLFVVAVALTRYVSLGSVVMVSSHPVMMISATSLGWPPGARPWLLAGSIAIGLVIVFKHRENLGRLVNGTEKRLGETAEHAK